MAQITQTPARARLLAAAMDFLSTRGISELSLRELAVALGTSHRMLLYHFNSKEGLLTEVVGVVEQARRDIWEQVFADSSLAPDDRPARLWARLSAPAHESYARLFFEFYGQALQGREPATTLLDGDTDVWMGAGVPTIVDCGYPAEHAPVAARLGLAVFRGLLMDLLATGDRATVDEAMGLFLSWFSRACPQPEITDRRATPPEPT